MAGLSRLGVVALALCVGLTACSSDDEDLVDSTLPAETLYRDAENHANAKSYKKAAELYNDVERLYPYSQLAKSAMIKAAHASYNAEEHTDARLAAERFLDFYPSDEQAPYAQYLVALSYYDQISDVGRDQGDTIKARQALNELIRRYPNTEYARDAELKRDLTLDNLAGKEMEIGRYYLGRGHYMAAINRFRIVIEEYNTTSQTPEALHRLVEAYLSLGVTNEAQNAAAVLGHNFPGSDWYVDSYAMLTGERLKPTYDEESWLGRNYRKVFLGDLF
ncbi:MAG: outer membrane protein assembly factor BamD [Pikeienuella sp.]